MLKIASFNTNGIRPRTPIILDWLKNNDPDVLCIQETKTQDPDFPLKPYVEAGYQVVFRGQKSYNGVAIISKIPLSNVQTRINIQDIDKEARFIGAQINNGIYIVNTYVPQGQQPDSEKFKFKLNWYKQLLAFFHSSIDPNTPVVWVGDLNVAPTRLDVFDPDKLYGSVCYHPDEHLAFKKFIDFGFVDIYRKHKPEEKEYTFWDYRIPNAVKRGLGWRIDHILATRPLAEKSIVAWIDKAPRLVPKPSDHTFIVAAFAV
ncbi:MAG: exodeoxyribonuclease III [Desulfobacterales bacterium]